MDAARLAARGLIVFLWILVAGCGGENDTAALETGTLRFVADGEDFVRNGFTASDGWRLTFRHFYVTLEDVKAYRTDPPYDPRSGKEIDGDAAASLPGRHTVDLAVGEQPVTVGVVGGVPTGHYNAISWNMVPATEGPSKGYSIYMDVLAEKDGVSYGFVLGIEDSYRYCGGEYVGDRRKGFVEPDVPGELEMTFHVDHLFGDGEQPEDSEINRAALGFGPFAGLAAGGVERGDLLSLANRLSPDDYGKLSDILPTLGHTGEGHCLCVVR